MFWFITWNLVSFSDYICSYCWHSFMFSVCYVVLSLKKVFTSFYLLCSCCCCLCLGAAARPALWAAEALRPPRPWLHRAERVRQQRVQCQNRVSSINSPVRTHKHGPLKKNILCDPPLSSSRVLGPADSTCGPYGSSRRCHVLQLRESGSGGGLVWGGRRDVFAAGEEPAGGLGGHIQGLQESRTCWRGRRGRSESAGAEQPGLWWQRRWSHPDPTNQVQRTGPEVSRTRSWSVPLSTNPPLVWYLHTDCFTTNLDLIPGDLL